MTDLDAIVERHRKDQQSVTALLQDLQEAFGYLPEEVLRQAAQRTGVPVSLLYSLATFYASFRLQPLGKHHVCICVGTACHVRGASRIVDALERVLGVGRGGTTSDGRFTLDTVNCVGACAMGPVVLVDKVVHGGVDQKAAPKLVRDLSSPGVKGGEEA